ncbi:hypothetical protein [Mucilaginibacter gilvus]|uniref:DUF4369 domain-containing protein n=1 Tax=Mucilaginibacter gilvus TaxID=2305909 RepID=A0A444MRL6_9SPHI|nr:hypothetical protein [Mucilaginibacter gilvus]RWY54233.1 hypothetical protein EPL05_09360 [Mucilaginibacter gilvus]
MKTIKSVAALLGLLFFISACHDNSKSQLSESTVVNLLADSVDDESWGADVRLSIVKIKKLDTSDVYTLKAIYKNKPVGFAIEVPRVTDKNSEGFGSGIKIKSLGKLSDDFKNAMAELYKQKIDTTKKFIDMTEAAYVDLIQFSKSMESNAKEDPLYFKMMKLFLMSKEGEEAELYFNIDKERKIVELKEKDEEYRAIVIQLISAP